MELTVIVAILGFLFASYSVVGNDVIQTLGTFLTSNEKRPWWVLWLYAGGILAAVMIYGWATNGGDMAYGRLEKFPLPETLHWWYVIPPLTLLFITRLGIPVSTTFLILSVFGSGSTMGKVILKSVTGYGVAFLAGIVIYLLITNLLEKRLINTDPDKDKYQKFWVAAQWLSTGFLWSQWLIQDLANIYVYLPRQLTAVQMLLSLGAILGLLAYIFYVRGGAIQGIVKSKTNTEDIRSATIIDLIFGIILLIFKEWSNLPMSTTWVFIGLLSGREYAISFLLKKPKLSIVNRMSILDLGKTLTGLIVSIALVFFIKFMAGETIEW
jgi:phosphate/sulfate permease